MYCAGIAPMVGTCPTRCRRERRARARPHPAGAGFRGRRNFHVVLHALAIAFAVIAAVCIVVAIAGMATGRPSARAGLFVRLLALACFVAAVALNVADRAR